MIDDRLIEQVYNELTVNPQRSQDIAERLHMPPHRVSFILAILKRQNEPNELTYACMLAFACMLQEVSGSDVNEGKCLSWKLLPVPN